MTSPASLADAAEAARLPWPRGKCPTFEQLVSSSGEDLDLALAAALVARDVYEDVDVPGLFALLDELALPLADGSLEGVPAEAQARALSRHIYERHGFAGNDKDYYDPRNSLLPDVLRRRLGIPISLALVYCEVAKRAGVRALGVSFPGHFLVRIERAAGVRGGPVFVDPFSSGKILDRQGLASLLSRVTGKRSTPKPEHLEAATPRATLLRMLTNLKAVYLARGEVARALLVADRILSVIPDSPSALRDRGLLAARAGAVQIALADLQRFVQLFPDNKDLKMVTRQLEATERTPHTFS